MDHRQTFNLPLLLHLVVLLWINDRTNFSPEADSWFRTKELMVLFCFALHFISKQCSPWAPLMPRSNGQNISVFQCFFSLSFFCSSISPKYVEFVIHRKLTVISLCPNRQSKFFFFSFIHFKLFVVLFARISLLVEIQTQNVNK